MAQLNFPLNATTGTQYTGDNGTTYIFDGTRWIGHSPNLEIATNSISNNMHVIQVDGAGNLVLPDYVLPITTGLPGQMLTWPNTGTVLTWTTATGESGGHGFTGSVGPVGYTGSSSTASGYTGSLGYTGSIGPQGYTGSSSTASGYTGSLGYTGSIGPQGYTGSASTQIGYTGSIGPQGTQGYTGSGGYAGSQGNLGYTGSLGDTGYTGSIGPQGYTGSIGPLGYTGSIGPQGITGYSGSQGIIGYSGSIGPQGYTGSVGVSGPSGPSGPQGPIGLQGVSVTLVGSTSTSTLLPVTGNPGDGWIVTQTGDLWFWSTAHSRWEDIGKIIGPAGPQGPQGYTGSASTQIGYSGSVGPQGYSGSIGPQGYTGSVGTRGNTGPTGPQGATGYTGSFGSLGYSGSAGVVGYTGSIGPQGYSGSLGYSGSAWTGTLTTSTLVNGIYSVSVDSTGSVNLVNASDGAGALLQSNVPVRIDSNGNVWSFKADGGEILTITPFGGDNFASLYGQNNLTLSLGNNDAVINVSIGGAITVVNSGTGYIAGTLPSVNGVRFNITTTPVVPSMVLPGGSTISTTDSGEQTIIANGVADINVDGDNGRVVINANTFTYIFAGGLTFPDSTVQSTAFTGTATSLANGGPSITVDNGGNLTVPGTVFANGVTVTGGITIPNNGQAGSIQSQNGQGNIYFNTDNSLIFIITGTYQVSFNPDGTVTFPGYIFPEGTPTAGQVLTASSDNPLYLEWDTPSGGSGFATTSTLINGTSTFTLNATGSLTFPDSSVQTTAWTGVLPNPAFVGSTYTGLASAVALNINNTGPVGQVKTQLNLINTAGNAGTGSAIDYFTYVDQGNGLPGARLQAVDDNAYSANFSIALKGKGNTGNNGLTTVWNFGSDGTLTLPGLINFGQNNATLAPPQPGGATDRIRIWDFQNANPSGVNYAIGAEGSHMWFATDVVDNTGGFKFYSTTTQVFKIGGDGSLNFADGSIQTTAWTGSTRWSVTPAVEGCPIYTELTPDHFYAYTQQSHAELENTGYWNVGSNYYGTYVGNDYNTLTNLYIIANDTTGTVSILTAGLTNRWTFGSTGTLTLPNGGAIGSTSGNGIALTTDRGTVLFGNSPEICGPTGASHFHIMKQDPTLVDLFFGDDFNNLKLPTTGGVSLQAFNTQTTISSTWTFGTNGTLTAPGDILPATNKTQSLGSPTQQWKSLYVSTSTIYMNNVPLTIDTTVNQIIVGNQDTGNVVNVASEAYVAQQIATVSRPMAIDGGGSSTLYEIETAYVDGGTASVRHGSQDSVFDGSYGNNYSLNGGGANG